MSARLEKVLGQAKLEATSEFVLDATGSIECTLKQALKGTKFEGRVHAHLFRHSFITHMLLAGNPMAVVGHIVADGPQTLTRYTHVTTEYARDNLIWGARREASAVVDLEAERAKRTAA
jgi:integrase